MKPSSHRVALRIGQGLVVAAAVTACGGGGGADAGAAGATPPAVKATVVKGVAATGSAIAGASVTVKCASGTASATTAADGSFSIDLSAATAPCMLRVSAPGAAPLHSLLVDSGSATVTANITPATELVVARLSGVTPAAYFDAFGAGAAAGVSAAQVQAADAAVVSMLKNAGADLSGVGGALSGTLVAAHGATAGNAYDQALDTLNAALASTGSTLATYAAKVAGSSPAVVAPSTTPSLPPDLLLSAAAANCPSMRSGNYWLVINGVGRARWKIDATRLSITEYNVNTGAQANSGTLTATGPCRFRWGGALDMAWSPAGLAVFETDAPPGFHGALIIPAQAIAPFELAGDWNLLGMEEAGANNPPALAAITASVDATGSVTAAGVCTGVSTGCRAGSTGAAFRASAYGYLELRDPDGSTRDAYAFRAGSGELMLLLMNGKSFMVGVRRTTLAMPALGRLSTSMTLQLDTVDTSLYPIGDTASVVAAVDGANGRYTRTLTLNAGTGLTRPEVVVLNDPSAGFLHRPAATATASDGSSSTVRETVMLDLPGTGLTVTAFAGGTTLQLSVAK